MVRYELGKLKPQLDAMGVQLIAVGLVSRTSPGRFSPSAREFGPTLELPSQRSLQPLICPSPRLSSLTFQGSSEAGAAFKSASEFPGVVLCDTEAKVLILS